MSRRPLFTSRARPTAIERGANVIGFLIEVAKMGIQAYRERKNPKRATEILDGELMVERIRRDGHMSVGQPERDEP